ncbi:hypothetical protein DFP92_10559 [Yoonia sediminilitoris]|uniref:Uncharacterized protein n=1 Tax=Yoonia sediminilitoris TaxID=1286148 RepID=A0A2T6KH57_9RHOB|nr:hypothetical protein C8N45_10559 [Yoonia sediminilitoris]RCW95555.1 hypothetical protein DFP92_10559 [Yoonia sediminilitoris]
MFRQVGTTTQITSGDSPKPQNAPHLEDSTVTAPDITLDSLVLR